MSTCHTEEAIALWSKRAGGDALRGGRKPICGLLLAHSVALGSLPGSPEVEHCPGQAFGYLSEVGGQIRHIHEASQVQVLQTAQNVEHVEGASSCDCSTGGPCIKIITGNSKLKHLITVKEPKNIC